MKNYLNNIKLKNISFALALVVSAGLTGCASVEGYSSAQSTAIETHAKSFPTPPEGYAGVYIIRKNTVAGAALKKSLYIDGQYIGESAKGTYFYRLVKPGAHKIETESEFGENELNVDLEEGNNSSFEQYIKIGVFVGGANITPISDKDAKLLIQDCTRAKDQDDKSKDLKTADYSEGKGSIPAPLTNLQDNSVDLNSSFPDKKFK